MEGLQCISYNALSLQYEKRSYNEKVTVRNLQCEVYIKLIWKKTLKFIQVRCFRIQAFKESGRLDARKPEFTNVKITDLLDFLNYLKILLTSFCNFLQATIFLSEIVLVKL